MRRSFKVATAFTGVAALAGGVGPTALATTTYHVRPAFKVQQCGANNGGVSNWVHLYYPHNDHPAECIAGPAKNQAVNATVASFCSGNNYGSFYGSYNGTKGLGPYFFGGPGGKLPIKFWTASHNRVFFYSPFHISRITITGWSGRGTCPAA
jgi:hypothetical protein